MRHPRHHATRSLTVAYCVEGRAQARSAAEAQAKQAVAAAHAAQAKARAGSKAGAGAKAGGPPNGWMGEHRNAYPYGGQGYHYIPSQFRHPPPPPPAPIPPPPPPPQFGTANEPYQVHRAPSSASFLQQSASVGGERGAAQRSAEAEKALHLAASQRYAAESHEASMMNHLAQQQQHWQEGQMGAGMPPPPSPPARPPPPPGPSGA